MNPHIKGYDQTMPDYNPRRVGAVITFPEGMTEQEVRNALIKFGASLPNGHRIETLQTGIFDPKWGRPVFYVP